VAPAPGPPDEEEADCVDGWCDAAAADVDGAFDQLSKRICLLLITSEERWLSPDAALC
jgi:hypothetical protein